MIVNFDQTNQSNSLQSSAQRTLRSPVSCRGVGLHSGKPISITLRPAPIDHGIVFLRTDVPKGKGIIKARWDKVVDTMLCTKIANEFDISISTIEHLMAALYICEIDNVLIESDGPEVPAMDGSAAPFVFLIECGGFIEQGAPRPFIRILKPIQVGVNGRRTSLEPALQFSISFELDFQKLDVQTCNPIKPQSYSFAGPPHRLKTDVMRARSFVSLEMADKLQRAGLVRGGSLDNAVVINGDKVLNKEGLRYQNEFVRHKVLDAVGDLYLAGAPILGHYNGIQAGHEFNNKLLTAMFSDQSAWCMVESRARETRPWIVTKVNHPPRLAPATV